MEKTKLPICSKYTFNEMTKMSNDAVEYIKAAKALLEKLECEAERISDKAYWDLDTTRDSFTLGRDALADQIRLADAAKELGNILFTLGQTAVAYHLRDIAMPE